MTAGPVWRRLELAALAAVVASLPFYRFGLSLGGQSVSPIEATLLLATALVAGRLVLSRWRQWRGPLPPAPSPVRGRGGDDVRANPSSARREGPGGESNSAGSTEATPSERSRAWAAFDLPIMLFLAAALLSLLATEYLRLSLRELRSLVVEPVLFWYLCRAVVRSPRDIAWLVAVLVGSASLVAVIGLVQLVLGGAVTDVQGVRRVLGTYTSPNHFALLLGRALPFLAAFAWCLPRWRPYAIAGGVLCAGALLATFSVGGWLATALALLVVAGLLGGRRLVAALLVAGIVAGAVVLLAAPVERLAGRLDPRQGTSFVRVQLWQTAVQLVGQSPLLGIGLDNFLYRYPALIPPGTPFEPNLSHPHNWVLQFWLQLGLAGLLALCWLLWRFLQLAWTTARNRAAPALTQALAVGALGSMVDFVTHGLVDNGYFLPDMAVIFWLTLAVAVVAGSNWTPKAPVTAP